MGAHESTARRVSFGLDEDMKVTVIEGVKLSEDVLRWMREHRRSDSEKSSTSPTDGNKPPESPKPTGASATEIQKELRKDFERQQAFVKESLSRLAQKERETAATTGLDELIVERGKVHEEQEKAKLLAKQLQSKEMELASISSFYKEQIEVLEKKNFDIYKESAEQYNQAATKAEARISEFDGDQSTGLTDCEYVAVSLQHVSTSAVNVRRYRGISVCSLLFSLIALPV
ncbi:hypothetical protein JOB18_024639 [Solea senegalensis]|uniref:MICOS complex subunit MIC19 n=1 Tax=Solea senegalensis TaxID=28829 RepID=A0AAV6QNA0_SOLSE|nr:hypothetical protein JOB18_024639 [Solea senegalensis]